MNNDSKKINVQEISYEAKNENDLLLFCDNYAVCDNSLVGHSFDYSCNIFLFSVRIKKENSISLKNFFFQKIINDECLYLLLDSKLTDVDGPPDPETSNIIFYQPKMPSINKIIKIDHDTSSLLLKRIESGDFPSYSVHPEHDDF